MQRAENAAVGGMPLQQRAPDAEATALRMYTHSHQGLMLAHTASILSLTCQMPSQHANQPPADGCAAVYCNMDPSHVLNSALGCPVALEQLITCRSHAETGKWLAISVAASCSTC